MRSYEMPQTECNRERESQREIQLQARNIDRGGKCTL
jgi:hypothetical protein